MHEYEVNIGPFKCIFLQVFNDLFKKQKDFFNYFTVFTIKFYLVEYLRVNINFLLRVQNLEI